MPTLKLGRPFELLKRLPAAWNHFWFEAIDARIVGLMRILLGLIVLTTHLSFYDELEFVLGPEFELYTRSSLHEWTSFSFYDHVESIDELYDLHTLFLIPVLMMIFGIGGRAGTLGVLVLYCSLHHGNTWMLNAGDRLTRLSALAMLLVPNTRAWALDSLIMRKLGRPMKRYVPRVTCRLVAIQIAWMYLATGIAKFEGSHWHGGTALYYALNTEVFQRFPGLLTHEFFASWPIFVITAVGTWVTLWWELLWPVLVLWRPTRIAALVTGVLIHGGIALLMMVASFSFASTWGYISYLDPKKLAATLDRFERRIGLTPIPAFGISAEEPAAPAAPAAAPA